MARAAERLTGVWHGLYTYAGQPEPVYFMATLIDAGTSLTGATRESAVGERGAPLTLHAAIEGTHHASAVVFTKTYDGSGGWSHAVAYDGALNAERTEIEGRWTIGAKASGRFLMIRSQGASETVVRKAFARA